ISEGQVVNLNISSKDEDVLAKVYSVGKSFESQSRAIHVLAEIENKDLQFFPGTYVKARIRSERNSVLAFPEEAIVEVEDRSYVFIGISEENGDWEFSAEEIKIQGMEDRWVSIQF